MTSIVNRMAPTLTGSVSRACSERIRELRESGGLVHYACRDVSALRRDASERDRDTILRPAFVRDGEKILHMPAYNRLNGKTQVFSFRPDDDITRRGLHEQLVGRVARDIGRALGLNLDLIEAIALGHDVGHTPFGHAGERFLNEVFHERTGRWFFHNVQSVRVLDVIYGRNLSLQTLDGVICHNGERPQRLRHLRPRGQGLLGVGRGGHRAPAAHDARGLCREGLGHHRLCGEGSPGRHPRRSGR